jgi:hypothetical protein
LVLTTCYWVLTTYYLALTTCYLVLITCLRMFSCYYIITDVYPLFGQHNLQQVHQNGKDIKKRCFPRGV